MADDIVTSLREMATDRARYATHSDGCVERHLECAALRACDEIERLRADVARLGEFCTRLGRRPVVANDIVISLRLLAHPFLGAAGISATERDDLRQAATTIEQLQALATELAEALEALLDNPGEYGAAFTALSHWHHRTCCPATPAD